MIRILLLENGDPFAPALAGILKANRKVECTVGRPEDIPLDAVRQWDKLIFAFMGPLPGPDYLASRILGKYHRHIPVLGIGQGHEVIGQFFGAALRDPVSKDDGLVRHLYLVKRDHYLFRRIPDRSAAGLFPGRIVARENFPDSLRVLALSEDDEIMAFSHHTWDLCGFRYRPESDLTRYGKRMIVNWINH